MFGIYLTYIFHVLVIYVSYTWRIFDSTRGRKICWIKLSRKRKTDIFLIDLHGRYFFLLLFSFIFSHSHSAQMFLWHCTALHFTALHCSELQYFISHLIKITIFWDVDLDFAYISLVQDKKNTNCHFG